MRFSVRDITIVSAGASRDAYLRKLADIHVRSLESVQIGGRVFVDGGCDPFVSSDSVNVIKCEQGSKFNESVAKNIGLSEVKTPVVVFTNSDVVVWEETIAATIDRLNAKTTPRHFIVNASRWDISKPQTSGLIDGSINVRIEWGSLKNFSIPAMSGQNAMGDWQVCLTEDAREIGGWDEMMTGNGGAEVDFHERMRACVFSKNQTSVGEIFTRAIPALRLYHTAPQIDPYNHSKRLENMQRFLQSGTVESLNWSA